MPDNNNGIIWACENGHIEMVKFLLSIKDKYPKINITANNNQAIISACANGKTPLNKWRNAPFD